MNPVEIIRKKRDGGELDRWEMESFVTSYLRGAVTDYQMAAFLMAVFFRGMNKKETLALTQVMLHSGTVVDLSTIPGIKVDKHSTGGVGDKVSLILAPIVAGCGVPVPMISGRGLGHTGGTLDKLESIPGFRTGLSLAEFKHALQSVGAALIGQTPEIVPADKRMYALRDVTATIESVPLIAGSIMSKKLAEGIDALVLDVKTGNGAFMQSMEESIGLASTLVDIGTGMGKETIALITDMSQPLGYAIGNWLEVMECVDCLKGKDVRDLMEVTYALGGAMLYVGRKAGSMNDGIALCRSGLWSGAAHEKFLQIVKQQGGDTNPIENPEGYPLSLDPVEVLSETSGFITAMDTRSIGLISVELGAGRMRIEDDIDYGAGILLRKKLGDPVAKGEPLALLFSRRRGVLHECVKRFLESVTVAQEQISTPPLIHGTVTRNGFEPWSVAPQY